MSESTFYGRPSARDAELAPAASDPAHFHRTLPGYVPTRLVEVPQLADELGVGRVFVKEEAERFGLPAFKFLGASHAVSRELSRRLGHDGEALPFERLRVLLAAASEPVRLVAATDGNHGRAVAHAANLLGIPATIFVPPGPTETALAGIESEGATLVRTGLPYDDVVLAARAHAAEDPTAILVQDSGWEGYRDIPQWIVDGYRTLFAEAEDQLAAAGTSPDLVVLPSGVGSLAETAVVRYRSDDFLRPGVLVVEPASAPCLLRSLQAGHRVTVETGETVMAGLNCGSVSASAWPALRDGVDGCIAVEDADDIRAVHDLERLEVDSGPCGASTLAAVRAVAADPARCDALGLHGESVVLLISTESRRANPLPV